MDSYVFRKKCRAGHHTTHSSNVCPGHLQANLIVLPKEVADQFEDLCFRNPVPCPLIGKTEVGDPTKLVSCKVITNPDIDLSRDVPKYNIYSSGKLVDQKLAITKEWTLDHVGFLIGCSYSFENELCKQGLPPRNVVDGTCVSMYRTKRLLDPAGIFTDCPYVVSMRPYKKEDLERVRKITSAFQKFHGGPIAWGFDQAKDVLGIEDINRPDFGEPTPIAEDEIPVFWGCGVTPQAAVAQVGDKIKGLSMGHTPGHMLVLDMKDDEVFGV